MNSPQRSPDMLSKNADGIVWMFRSMERSENIARLIEAGLRIALTRSGEAPDEWRSILTTVGATDGFERHGSGEYTAAVVTNYLLRARTNPGSVMALIESARTNARTVRTAITQELWEATNECYMTMRDRLSRQVRSTELVHVLGEIRRQSALVRGALHGTMLRNDAFSFAQIGTYLERADNTARIIDMKYYVLLPSLSMVGSSLDNVQWDTILRSLSAQRGYHWLHPEGRAAFNIASFLILDDRFPRSLAFSVGRVQESLRWLEQAYGERHTAHDMADDLHRELAGATMEGIFDFGLHESLQRYLHLVGMLARQIEHDFRFRVA
ncbi:MAG: alpha-E domain-containing protein [Thermoleophilia bacterium]